jgi:dipeptidyl aminopeptidase/acylaminoacyl peptidase
MIKSLFGGFTALVILILISTMVVIPVLADGNGKIAYMASDTGSLGHFEIWVMDDDGTSPVQLTTDTEWDGQPAWSPDGTKIAFVGSHYSNADIWVMDADGSNPVQVTTHAADDYDPAWSRDGTKIAFGSDRDADPETRNDIWVIDADGSNPVQLTTDPAQDTNPTWSPDGTKIAFESNRGGQWDIWVMDADGNNQVKILDDPISAGEPAWSPDGTKIAFSSHLYDNGDIFVVDADGSNRVQVTTHHYNDINPAWSSDSSQIVYASWGDDDTWDIWKVNADGSSLPVQLTSGPAYEYSPSWYGEPEGDCVNDLQAVSGSGSVHLTWTDTGASSYAVYRGTMSGGPYVYLGSVSNPQYNDLTVTVGTTYYYVVRTVDPTGQEICQSNEVQVIVSENVPEFPSVILPEVCIIGILSVIFFIRRK